MGSVLWILARRLWWLAPMILATAVLARERIEIGHLRRRIAACQAAAVRQQASIAQLRAGIATQNAGVENLLETAHRAQAQFAEAEQARQVDADRLRRAVVQRVARVDAAPVPTLCASAVAWGAEQAAGLARGWGR